MKLQAAFIFAAPGADYKKDRSSVDTPAVHLTTVGVKDYADGVLAAKELVASGITAIELCGGFGSEGMAMIVKAVEGKAVVGAVRFDCHPGLDFKSGDEVFQ